MFERYSMIICSGLSARYLVNDQSVKPVRGHVIRMKAPWVKGFIRHVDNDDKGRSKHILVNQDTVVIGSLKQQDCTEPKPQEGDKKWTMLEAKRFVPSLEYAEYVVQWVGFRPSRPTVRLEKEI
ncbi:D-aspartate oxidase-like [Hydractinia symbiolongicarpus]|uniref:D-aspartate oxidase-like n=1 Tax=Hydractinia symbiolongicarpus TaxID=13093 RepID=UPI00255187B0|nr:D-aspartate oxidase-like [Hydractinia symbiolongicarpus]